MSKTQEALEALDKLDRARLGTVILSEIEIMNLQETIKAALKATEWETIDSCPKDQWVYAYYPEKVPSIGMLKENGFHWSETYNWNSPTFNFPTHWQPLPAPPALPEKDGE